jgi:tRNA G18 (ribose-2'-O)-methylase SpoU
MRSVLFQKKKFQKLGRELQHRKCAELLRSVYECLLEKKPCEELWGIYLNYLLWMQLDPNAVLDVKLISDRYHWHLGEAKILIKEHNLLSTVRRGDREEAKEEFPPCAVYLDNLRSAYNVGSILRTMEALRIGGLYFAGKTPYIDNPKVHRTSMGASQIVPCYPEANLKDLPRPIIAIETSDEAHPVSDFIFPPAFTLILGNEEYGISDAALSQADYMIHIPLFGKKNSINVACAFAICAQEIRRQKEGIHVLQ